MTTNEGKVALVTGASYGLGAMTADFLARDGFDVALTDLNVADLADTIALVEKHGRKAFATSLDVRSVDSIDAAIAERLVDGRMLVFGGVTLFFTILILGFVYTWRKGVFQWR